MISCSFKEVTITTIEQFMNIAAKSTEQYLFRGQSGKYKTISSSLEKITRIFNFRYGNKGS
jgi:hypothetical protein